MNETNYLIEVEDLTKEFERPTDGPLKVLAGVSLTLSVGDTMALMGPNGCGKTTLLRIISGELVPTAGKIYLAGKDSTNMPAHERARFIGRVHQESYKSLASELTVEETLALATRRNTSLSFGLPSAHDALKTIRSFSEKAAAFVEPRKKLATRTLSGGQRQLLAIITAILGQPRVLLLDEHQASLDEEVKTTADALIQSIVSAGHAAAMAATHNLEWVNRECSKIAFFEHGNVKVRLRGEKSP